MGELAKTVAVDELVPGRTYTVELQDCCIEATLRGVFQRLVYNQESVTEPDAIEFDIGLFTRYDQVSFADA